jgi:hypothetical protein
MDKVNDYESWAQIIDEMIRSGGAAGQHSQTGVHPVRERLIEFVSEAGLIVSAIGRNIKAVEIQDRNRYDFMGAYLDQMLRFDEFSLIEYRYITPAKEQPGIRFKAVKQDDKIRIVAVYFPDLVFWPVDEAGERISMEICEFEVSSGEICARPHDLLKREYIGCTSWQKVLRETLAMPFRSLFEPGWNGVNAALFNHDGKGKAGRPQGLAH